MRLASTLKFFNKIWKIVLVLFSFLLIVLLPLKGLSSNTEPTVNSSNPSDIINNILSMAGGGGIGVAGSKFLEKKQQPLAQNWETPEPSGLHVNNLNLQARVNEIERRWLKNDETVRNHQKKLASKLNAIEFFLGKKFDDYNRKDTEY